MPPRLTRRKTLLPLPLLLPPLALLLVLLPVLLLAPPPALLLVLLLALPWKKVKTLSRTPP